MKIRHDMLATLFALVVQGCSFLDSPSVTDQVVGGKTTLYGIGLPCATADQICQRIYTFPGIPWEWCGCADYIKIGFSRPQKLVQIGLRPADTAAEQPWKIMETTWPSQMRLDNLLPDRPAAQNIARNIEISLANLPQPNLAAFRDQPLAQKIKLFWQDNPDLLFLDIEAALQAEGL